VVALKVDLLTHYKQGGGMKRWLQFLLTALILSSTQFANATHIVGGSLTYVHNGGSSYTVTLKLYRDCGPGTAGLPGSVVVVVEGYNGAGFATSRDITMNLSTVTPITASLDPCAIAPNPAPCVEEGLYTTTVNNLPPNPGGYHMYYQIIARNLTLVNVNGACNCIGESFYAYIPGNSPVWEEDFNLADGVAVDNGATAWTISQGAIATNQAEVNGGLFEWEGDDDATSSWFSEVVNITPFPAGVALSAELSETGNFENSDSILVYYRLNGAPPVLFAVNGSQANDFGNVLATQGGLVGATIQVIVRVVYGGNSPNNERYQLDNVSIFGNDFQSNDNAEFNLFPPLFLCVNQAFTFDHSATDSNGDSLVYSLYTPYDGDNGAGALDPTYVNNTAIFTPVVYLPGYGTNNPLGGPNINIDPNTGLMTGTPTILGQFVVGVKVTSYRNGVYLDETLRDFQFNVLNCPQPNPPVAGTDLIINDGCTQDMAASGYVENTVTWNSIAPGAPGAYNSFLSCTNGCLDPTVTGAPGAPAFVDYVICGNAASCNNAYICDTVRVTFNPTLNVTIAPQNPVICFGQTSITLTATGTGGTPPYSYLWNNVNPSQTNIVGAGTYTVELSDNSGCPPAYSTITVTAFNVPITANAGVDDTVCIQNPTFQLNGVVTGAGGGRWSGGAGLFSPNDSTLNAFYTPTPGEISAGTVTLFLNTIGNSTCPPDADTITITFLDFIGTASVAGTDVTCFGLADGTATANVVGGIAPFTYLWNTAPAQTTQTATGLAPGTYTVTIQNGIGCTVDAQVVIGQPAPLVVNTTASDVLCNGGSTGGVTTTIVGGTGPYTYSWSNGPITQNLTNEPAGMYTITVTDASGCVETSTATINEPAALAFVFATTDVTCAGGNDGTASSTDTGGTSPYTYSWTPIGGSSANAIGLSAGNYDLTVTDANGCTLTATATVAEPGVLTASATATDETCDYSDDGTVTVTPAGGTPGYTYLWTPGNFVTATVTNLAAGTYTVTVTDASGCTATTFATVNEPLPITITTAQSNVNCNAGNDGSISASVSGGTAGYTYSWAPGGATTPIVNGLAAGNYTVTVTDANGCQAQSNVVLTEPSAAVSATVVNTPASCAGGSDGALNITPAGGTSPYSFLWLPGGQTTEDLAGIPANNYSVTITDANGCTENYAYVVVEPTQLSIAFNVTNASCNGTSTGSITATVNGGTAGFLYNWTPSGASGPAASSLAAGMHVLNITDANGCTFSDSVAVTEPTTLQAFANSTDETCDYLDNGTATATEVGGTGPYTYSWMPGALTTPTITNLAAGNYTVTITDANGCVANATTTVSQPSPLVVSFNNQINVSCNGDVNGAVTGTPSGGTPNYIYGWAPGGATTASINGVGAGNYNLTVTDQNGCTATNSVTITQPPVLTVAPTFTAVSCPGGNDGTATATPAGGTGPFTYNWVPGNLAGQVVTNLTAGTYTVTVTDNNGCTATNSVAVTEPGAFVLNPTSVSSNCGFADGSASVTVTSGGTAPFTYQWFPSGQTTQTAVNLLAGLHSVLVTDANGCTAIGNVNVNDLAAPTLSISNIVNVTCFGGSDGSATVTAMGGVGPFTYLWSPGGQTTPVAVGLVAGSYTVSVTGANGCVSTATVVPAITQPDSLILTVNTTAVSCNGGNNGTASVSATGGTPGYTFTWLPSGATGTSITGLAAGLDSVMITDANGCSSTVTFLIDEPVTAQTVVASSTNVSCNSGNDGTASAVGSGGTAPYSYVWNPGGINGANVASLTAGNYTVTLTDFNGCTATDNVTLTEPTPLALVPSSANSTCSAANGQASVVASGGTPGYTYQWFPTGGTGPIASGLPSGTYTVTVTDANGCTASTNVNVVDTPGPSASVSGSSNVSCFGGSDGTATVTVTGGTSPFSYQWSPSGGTGATATGLSVGFYSVVVTDANGCQSNVAFSPVITQPNPIVIGVSTTSVSCNGGNDGTASASVNGGTPGYTYSWLPGGNTGPSVNTLAAGLNSVTVTDANGCTETNNFTITEPAPLVLSVVSTSNVNCLGGADGTGTVSASGGTPFYSYNWTPFGGNSASAVGLISGNYVVNVTDQNGCTSSVNVAITQPAQALTTTASMTPSDCFGGATGTATAMPIGGTPGYSYLWNPSGGNTQTITNVGAGTQTVTVTDANGCSANAAVTITQPTPITANLAVVQPSCGLNNGALAAQVSGGTFPYSYSWSPGGAITSSITGLAPGVYNVTITDANGCTATLSETLVNIPGPTVAIPIVSDVTCFGGNDGFATAVINGGTAPFAMNWTPYGGNALNANTLDTGSYTITVIDALGCQATATTVITSPTEVLIDAVSVTNVSCNGAANGSITVAANGGNGPYTYVWMPGGAVGGTISNIGPGSYVVTATDANGCTASISIPITQPAPLGTAIANATNPTCFTSTNGSATAQVTGGTPPYTYQWSNGEMGVTAVMLTGGIQTVTITDALGCQVTASVTITQPGQVLTVAGPDATICVGQTATITASASGGVGNYSFAWQPVAVVNAGTLNDGPITTTNYVVQAFDQNGCPGSYDTVVVEVLNLLPSNINAVASASSICPGQVTNISAITTGITDPLTYTWNNGLGNGPGPFAVTPGAPTWYVVTATNSCGISVQDSVQVVFSPPPTLVAFADTDTACSPGFIQFTDMSVTGNPADQIHMWFWDFGDGTTSGVQNPTHTYDQPGTYIVTLTVVTGNGCSSDNLGSPITITILQSPTAGFTMSSDVLNLPMDALATNNTSTGATSYLWDWGDGNTSTDVSPTYLYDLVGNFTVMLVAYNTIGCSDTVFRDLETLTEIQFPNAFTPTQGEGNGGFYDPSNLDNNVFFPYAAGVTDFKMQIFDRWGELIFETTDIRIGWDGHYRGKVVQQGVYIWKATATLNDGQRFSNIGDVTVLR